MSTDDLPLSGPERDHALAAEMALGLLEGDEARAAADRQAADPAFAREVRMWHERFAALADELTPVLPPARARHAIRERLGHASAPLANDPTETTPWWRGTFGVIAGLVVAAAVALFVILPGLRQSGTGPGTAGSGAGGGDAVQQAAYRAVLQSDESSLRVEAQLSGREMQISLRDGGAAAGRDLEIWWIAPDGSAPISIGLVPQDGDLRMTLPEGMEPSAEVQLALSDEPQGGSPTGQATGPVVAIGRLTSL